jgi:D-arabinose 1-dehydrogenase-like Zn-dependent alcohol dehydrogenase
MICGLFRKLFASVFIASTLRANRVCYNLLWNSFRTEAPMPETALLAAMVGIKKPFEIQEHSVPDPKPGAVLVKVHLANICGSDLHIWHGLYKPADPGAWSLRSVGHEMCGEVARLGDGVTQDSAGQPLAVGDRIVYCYFAPCNHCRACLRGRTPRCPHGMRHRYPPSTWPHFNAAYGQYYYLHPEQKLFKIPKDVSDDLAAPANCALAQVIDGLDLARATIGDTVVIQGAGGLGVLAAAVAKERGVSQIIVIDKFEQRLDLARQFGADIVIDMNSLPNPEARIKRVKDLTDGWGADVVLEVAGAPDAVPEGVAMLGVGGVYAEIGNICEGQTCAFDPAELALGAKSILGLMWYRPESLLAAMQFLSRYQKKYPFGKLIARRFPLKEINAAITAQDKGEVHRASLVMW